MKKAVGIKYDKATNAAPRVTAKGSGTIAEKIIKIAEENHVPIFKDPDLVEVLACVDIYKEIPEVAYQVIAEILAFVYTMNNKMKDLKGGI